MALAEFWHLWGTLAASSIAGIAFVALFILSPSERLRHIAILGALASFSFSVVFGLGAASRDSLCKAEHELAVKAFNKYLDEVNKQVAEYSASVEQKLKEKDAENAAKVAQMAAQLEGNACMPSPDRLEQLRNLRGITAPAKHQAQR